MLLMPTIEICMVLLQVFHKAHFFRFQKSLQCSFFISRVPSSVSSRRAGLQIMQVDLSGTSMSSSLFQGLQIILDLGNRDRISFNAQRTSSYCLQTALPHIPLGLTSQDDLRWNKNLPFHTSLIQRATSCPNWKIFSIFRYSLYALYLSPPSISVV